MTKQGITITVLLAGIIVSMSSWIFVGLANDVERNAKELKGHHEILIEMKAQQEVRVEQQEELNKLVREMNIKLDRLPTQPPQQ
jgi:hypothetical protein